MLSALLVVGVGMLVLLTVLGLCAIFARLNGD
jgi:hypothetical protein